MPPAAEMASPASMIRTGATRPTSRPLTWLHATIPRALTAKNRLNTCGDWPKISSMTNGEAEMYANIAAKASAEAST